MIQHWNSSSESLNTSTSRKSRSRWSTERRPERSGATSNQQAVSLALGGHSSNLPPPPMPTPPPNTPPPCLAILTWAEAPAATAVGYGCLRWGAIRPAGVAAVVSKVTDRVRDPRGIWWFVSLGLLSIGDFPRHGQENHMVTPTVWTYNRRFWREGQRPCEPPKGTHHVDTPPPNPGKG